MKRNPDYTFRIKTGNSEFVAQPLFDQNLARKATREAGQLFLRYSLTGPLTFVRYDYRKLRSLPYDQDVFVHIDKSNVNGTVTVNWWEGKFTGVDVRWDDDQETAEVTPAVVDQYTKVIESLNEEYELPDLQVPAQEVTATSPAIIQAYVYGASTLRCIAGLQSWDIQLNKTRINTPELTAMGFVNTERKYWLTGDKNNLYIDVTGEYTAVSLTRYVRLDGIYEIVRDQNNHFTVREVATGQELYFNRSGLLGPRTPIHSMSHEDSKFDPPVPVIGSVRMHWADFYVRLVITEDAAENEPNAVLITDDDIAPASSVYRYSLPLGPQHVAGHIQGNGATIDQELGVIPNNVIGEVGKFYDWPGIILIITNPAEIVPIGREIWGSISAWVTVNAIGESLRASYDSTYNVIGAMRLSELIKAFFSKIDDTLTHEELASFSEFLYAENSSLRDGLNSRPVIAPKRFFVQGVGVPADRTPIKFADVSDWLAKIYHAHWYIDEQKRFRIEHVSWFENGGSYDDQIISYDASVLIEPKNRVAWAKSQNVFTYDVSQLPQEITFSWMDQMSAIFNGSEVITLSGAALRGGQESRNIDRLSTDILFMLAGGNNVTSEGYVMLEVTPDNEVAVSRYSRTVNWFYDGQNMALSWSAIHDRYYLHNMPARNMRINNKAVEVETVRRSRVQQLTVGKQIAGLDGIGLIRSNLGVGAVRELSESFPSGELVVTIELDNH